MDGLARWIDLPAQQPDRGSMHPYLISHLGQAPAGRPSLLGTKLVKLPDHADSRGCLIALDRDQSLPFDVRRVYCIYQGHAKSIRGEHATSAHCALVALQGAIDVDLDNGQEQTSMHLSRSDEALCVHAGIWLRLRNFVDEAIVLVAASKLYAESAYFDHPNPELLEPIPHARWR